MCFAARSDMTERGLGNRHAAIDADLQPALASKLWGGALQ